jgi:hypothetical protein
VVLFNLLLQLLESGQKRFFRRSFQCIFYYLVYRFMLFRFELLAASLNKIKRTVLSFTLDVSDISLSSSCSQKNSLVQFISQSCLNVTAKKSGHPNYDNRSDTFIRIRVDGWMDGWISESTSNLKLRNKRRMKLKRIY